MTVSFSQRRNCRRRLADSQHHVSPNDQEHCIRCCTSEWNGGREIQDAETENGRIENQAGILEGHATEYGLDPEYSKDACDDAADCRAKAAAERDKRFSDQYFTDKRKERDDTIAEAEAEEQKIADLEGKVRQYERDEIPAIQAGIDESTAQRLAARQILDGDPNDQARPGDIELLRRCCGYAGAGDSEDDKARLASQKAATLRAYLEEQFERAATGSDAILRGEGANFFDREGRNSLDKDGVFAKAIKPTGTMDAWQALGAGVVERTIALPQVEIGDLTQLKEKIGTHRALVLAGKPAAGEFELNDEDQQDSYDDDAPTRGQHYEGIYKGIHGTLYFDEVRDEGTSTARNRWVFTPTTSVDRDPLRGKNPELFRYSDADGDGTWELVPHVDYGMWLSEPSDDTLSLNLLAGIVGPYDHREAVDVTTPHGAPGNTVARNDRLATNSASYSGTARGLSARSRDGSTASGHFTADVKLQATFGADAMLGGTIDNFRSADSEGQGTDHVSDDWSLTLDATPLGPYDHDSNSGTPPIGGGVDGGAISGSGTGEWSGVGYVEVPHPDGHQRPDGFYGGFRAEFTDGAAAGVYHAE